MVGDPISDMFSRINNASRVGKVSAIIPYSKLKIEIAKLLERRGLTGEAVRKGKKNRRNIELTLLYDGNRSKLTEIKSISKPSRRVYMGWRKLKPFKGGLGFYILSTPAGIMDDKQARRLKVGGEVLGRAW